MSAHSLPSFEHYWNMWNETDISNVRGHLDHAVTEDFIFCDPLHWHVGRDALEENVLALRAEHPTMRFTIASGVDSHHNRHRYHWNFQLGDRVMMKGFDVTTIADDGLIERIDGFFGDIPELE